MKVIAEKMKNEYYSPQPAVVGGSRLLSQLFLASNRLFLSGGKPE